MEPINIIEDFSKTGTIPDTTIEYISDNTNNIRKKLVNHFLENKDREFALAFIDRCIALRQSEDSLPGDDLMLASYILGLHNVIEDSLKIWEAKTTDFDAFCYVDIQLTVFSGVDNTIAFLKNSTIPYSEDALEYITECKESGDFDNLEGYYSNILGFYTVFGIYTFAYFSQGLVY